MSQRQTRCSQKVVLLCAKKSVRVSQNVEEFSPLLYKEVHWVCAPGNSFAFSYTKRALKSRHKCIMKASAIFWKKGSADKTLSDNLKVF